jgi:O-antigen ligase
MLLLIFGVFFYELIGFDPMDEIFQMVLIGTFLLFVFWSGDIKIGRIGIYWLLSFLFYAVYSFAIHSNVSSSILLDVLLQAKPFLGFLCVFYAGQVMSAKEKKILRVVVLVLFFVSLTVLSIGLFSGNLEGVLKGFYAHPSRYGTAIVLLSMFYLYTSKFNRKNKIIFLVMLSFGLFSAKGKFYGYYAFAVLLTLIYGHRFYLRLSFRNLIFGVLAISAVLFAAQEKLMYYSQGFLADKAETNDFLARPVLYLTAGKILQDYFPFGSGFGSFATYASRTSYSRIYEEYGIDKVWGLSRDYPYFIADTQYPSLAQFGVVGVLLFILFWRAIIQMANRYKEKEPDNPAYFFVVLIIVFLLIEMVADATFTYNRGFILMAFLGYLLNEYKRSGKLVQPETPYQ